MESIFTFICNNVNIFKQWQRRPDRSARVRYNTPSSRKVSPFRLVLSERKKKQRISRYVIGSRSSKTWSRTNCCPRRPSNSLSSSCLQRRENSEMDSVSDYESNKRRKRRKRDKKTSQRNDDDIDDSDDSDDSDGIDGSDTDENAREPENNGSAMKISNERLPEIDTEASRRLHTPVATPKCPSVSRRSPNISPNQQVYTKLILLAVSELGQRGATVDQVCHRIQQRKFYNQPNLQRNIVALRKAVKKELPSLIETKISPKKVRRSWASTNRLQLLNKLKRDGISTYTNVSWSRMQITSSSEKRRQQAYSRTFDR